MPGLSRGSLGSASIFILALVVLSPPEAGAQVQEESLVPPSTWWLTLGVGPTSAEVPILLSLTTAYRPGRAGSLRLVDASPFHFDFMLPYTGTELGEVALTWHLAKSLDTVWYSAGAGVGVASVTERTLLRDYNVLKHKVGPSPGLALEGRVHTHATGRIGAGLVAFAHLGDGTSFGGVVLALRAGRIR